MSEACRAVEKFLQHPCCKNDVTQPNVGATFVQQTAISASAGPSPWRSCMGLFFKICRGACFAGHLRSDLDFFSGDPVSYCIGPDNDVAANRRTDDEGKMRCVATAVMCFGLLTAAQAQGTCAKPEMPVCVTDRGPFSGEAAFDECRKLMISYKGGMERYASCLDESDRPAEGLFAQTELESVLARFNRRARGEQD